MNRTTARYLELCRTDGGALSTAVTGAELPGPLRGARLLARPLFVEEPVLRAAADDLLALFDVLTSLPDRLFDGDLDAYWAALGGEPRLAPLLRRYAPGKPAARFGRADLSCGEDGFALLEFNIAGGVGGIELGELPGALLAEEPFARFAAQHGLGHVRTGARVAATLRAVAPRPDPVVALVLAPGALDHYRPLLAPTVEVLHGQGLQTVLGELGEVREKNGKLYIGRHRADVLLRHFSVDDTIGYEECADAVTRAHRSGDATLWTPLDSTLYANKGALALLSDPRCDPVLSASERRLTDRILPWTRLLTPELAEQCRTGREHLVLKPCRGFAGAGIVAGWNSTDREWADALRRCADGAHVVQRRIAPLPEPVVDPRTGTTEDWLPVWGLYVTPDGYGGNAVRAQPATGTGVIGYSTSTATRATVAFSCRPDAQPAPADPGAVDP
ncbi:hypothetical protein ACFP1Z_11580 [Streptomyces gamaensis]|uniref:Circularly permuted type 2 ATP-grasp protein n=1 Tax=Streptomyces gamaensis TaxID=1763542 RepID=A0ABW0YWC2_9ACTN